MESNKKATKDDICVLQSIVKLNQNNFLDLGTTDGLKYFRHVHSKMLEKLKDAGKALDKDFGKDLQDGHVVNEIRNNTRIEIVKMNVFIMFNEEKNLQIRSRLPNTTIISVINVMSNVIKSSIKEVKLAEV